MACAAVPAAPTLATNQLAIEIVPGGWGDGVSLENIQRLLSSSAAQLVPRLAPESFGTVRVFHTTNSPITEYRRGLKGEIVVRLNARGTYWAQYAYQFAHELGHIICHYERVRTDRNPNQWFEEALCETASMFVLQQMAIAWSNSPPYGNWRDFAPKLAEYAADLEHASDRQLDAGVMFAQWYHQHEAELRGHATLRHLNGLVACHLLPLFAKRPEHWAAVSFLNGHDGYTSLSFAEYLKGWYARVPRRHKAFVEDIAGRFAVTVR